MATDITTWDYSRYELPDDIDPAPMPDPTPFTYLHGWKYLRKKWSEELINKETLVKKLHIDELRLAVIGLEQMAWVLHRDIRALDEALTHHIGKGGIERHPLATKTVAGFMSPAEHKKLLKLHPEKYVTKDELKDRLKEVEKYVKENQAKFHTRDFYQDFTVESFGEEGGYCTYTANFDIRSLERELGVGLEVFLVTYVSAAGSGSNDYFNGAMPLSRIDVDLPEDYTLATDSNNVKVKAWFHVPALLGHHYHIAGNVRLNARITCIESGGIGEGGSTMHPKTDWFIAVR